LNKVDLDLTVYLGGTVLKVKEILDLRVGDVVPLRARVNDRIPILVGGKHRFWGKPGVVKKHRAVQICDVLSTEEV